MALGTILHSELEDATPMSPVPVDTTMPENSQMESFSKDHFTHGDNE